LKAMAAVAPLFRRASAAAAPDVILGANAAVRPAVRVSGTATCFGVREGSRVVADPVGLWVVG